MTEFVFYSKSADKKPGLGVAENLEEGTIIIFLRKSQKNSINLSHFP
tara:strand:+ start:233 stop:373 length:141 start_codon:yes stop_codon:yes gene_type:complete